MLYKNKKAVLHLPRGEKPGEGEQDLGMALELTSGDAKIMLFENCGGCNSPFEESCLIAELQLFGCRYVRCLLLLFIDMLLSTGEYIDDKLQSEFLRDVRPCPKRFSPDMGIRAGEDV